MAQSGCPPRSGCSRDTPIDLDEGKDSRRSGILLCPGRGRAGEVLLSVTKSEIDYAHGYFRWGFA